MEESNAIEAVAAIEVSSVSGEEKVPLVSLWKGQRTGKAK